MAVKTSNPKMGRPVTNKHKVGTRLWDKWSNTAKRVFNKTFERMLRNQSVFMHPKAPPMSKVHWRTVAWNAAVIAACAADDVIFVVRK
jgi:hypothetical protein